MSTGAPSTGVSLPQQFYRERAENEPRNGTHFAVPQALAADDGISTVAAIDAAARFRQQGHLERTSSPISRASAFSPSMFLEASRGGQSSAPYQHTASPPPMGPYGGSDRHLDHTRNVYAQGPLDYASAASPAALAFDRPQSSLSERSLGGRELAHTANRSMLGSGAGSKEAEFSIFLGDLSPDLREEDLVTQFLQPPPWHPQHPCAIALARAQQMQGIYQPGARIGPAPFLSTKSAKIMTDPATGASRGYGFVRFTKETDCNRALVEMQGVVVAPSNGLSPGRPLRVSTATPKSRTSPNAVPSSVEPHSQPLQMPKPNVAAAEKTTSYLLQHSFYARYVVSPPPRSHPLPSAGMHFASPISPGPPSTPYDAAVPGGQSHLAAFLPHQSGNAGDHLERTVSPPSGRAYTPSNAGSSGVGGPPKPSALDPNNTTVFVGGLSSLISEDTLRQFFDPYGEITYVKIPPGKGCGFVQFVHKADAERAINLMNGFPIGNARIRLSWGRSQGDKAAAAAAQVAAQATQLGHLAGLAGLGALNPAQLAQLAGLGSALSAAQANASRITVVRSQLSGDQAAFSNDSLSTLAQQLAIASAVASNSGTAASFRLAQMPPQRAPHSSALQHLHHLQQSQQPQGPPFPAQHHARYDGTDAFRQLPQHDFEHHAALPPSTLQQLMAASNLPALNDGIYGRHQSRHPQGAFANSNAENDLVRALADLRFDGGATGTAQYKPRDASDRSGAGRGDGLRQLERGYTRDPSAFLFSPFSPADSPLVTAKAELPTEDEENVQHAEIRRESASGGIEA
ncbi:hypothetical protein ACQY0O_006701 [Thecaphora frezii]